MADQELVIAAVAAALIIVVLILMSMVCACNASDSEPYFYPTGMNDVSPVPHYRTIINFDTSEKMRKRSHTRDTQSTSPAHLNNGLKRGSSIEMGKDKTSGMFDFKPNPDDDIYTNMEVYTYTSMPPCAKNRGYQGDYEDFELPRQNDLRWDETKLDAGNIQPAFLFPHRPYGPRMGL